MTRLFEGSTFHSVGKIVYFSPSQVHMDSSSLDEELLPAPPTIIMIFGWMGANPSHIHKYTKVYEQLYPNATKLLIRCHMSFFWSRESFRRIQLVPVVETLQALGYLPPSRVQDTDVSRIKLIQPRLLIHAFSNGGCSQLLCLNRLIAAQYPDLNIVQTSTCAIIFDSCPGIGNSQEARRAMGTLVRSTLLRWLLTVVITWLYSYSAVMRRLFGMKNMPELLKIALNAPRLLPWVHKGTPRLYLYSTKDEMVPFREVEGHARDAEAAGLNIRSEVFEDTPHVCHARVEPERYWTAVKAVWEDACEEEMVGSLKEVK